MTESIWTEDKVQQLRDLKEVGLTSAKIAVCLGEEFSRNSVIDKATRLGIGAKEKLAPEIPREKFRPPKTAHVNKITLPAIGKPSEKYAWGFRPRAEPTVNIPAPVTTHVTLMERTGCAWPTNDGKMFLFCNAPVDGRASYCPHHAQRIYVGVR